MKKAWLFLCTLALAATPRTQIALKTVMLDDYLSCRFNTGDNSVLVKRDQFWLLLWLSSTICVVKDGVKLCLVIIWSELQLAECFSLLTIAIIILL